MAEQFRESKRARRRRDLTRMKAKARRIWRDDQMAHTLAEHMAWCPRGCCANPRRFYGELTMQERRAKEAAGDGLFGDAGDGTF